jgi:hypothetical protein
MTNICINQAEKCAGSFDGLDHVLRRRLAGENVAGELRL